ncbi:hypothetical protein DFJ73DRAFT_925908 [Zopfochytrium polystomum]|nr:hypothetical protein DFJ73DRAFT_925908 [Zopfochytrium polystomum]
MARYAATFAAALVATLAALHAGSSSSFAVACGSFGPNSCTSLGQQAICTGPNVTSVPASCVCDCCPASNTCDQFITSSCRKDVWVYDLVLQDAATNATLVAPNSTLTLTVGQSVHYLLGSTAASSPVNPANLNTKTPCASSQLATHGLALTVSGTQIFLDGVAASASTDPVSIVLSEGALGVHVLQLSLTVVSRSPTTPASSATSATATSTSSNTASLLSAAAVPRGLGAVVGAAVGMAVALAAVLMASLLLGMAESAESAACTSAIQDGPMLTDPATAAEGTIIVTAIAVIVVSVILTALFSPSSAVASPGKPRPLKLTLNTSARSSSSSAAESFDVPDGKTKVVGGTTVNVGSRIGTGGSAAAYHATDDNGNAVIYKNLHAAGQYVSHDDKSMVQHKVGTQGLPSYLKDKKNNPGGSQQCRD